MANTPSILALETDSAWVVILAVSCATLAGAIIFRKLIGKTGGAWGALLLSLPLVLPLVAALAFASAVLPEISVLNPASPSFLKRSTGPVHLLMLADERSRVVTPYAVTGSAGPWLLLIGGAVAAFMLIRRGMGVAMLHRLVARCSRPRSNGEMVARAKMRALVRETKIKRTPELLVLPVGCSGAFAVGGRRPRVLLSRDLIGCLDEQELEATLAHEVAHIEAKDSPLLFTAGLLRDLVAWNPLGHIAYKRLMSDREIEADRRAAVLTGRPLDVASGLLKVCEAVGYNGGRRARSALAFGGKGSLKKRVSGLLVMADGGIAPDGASKTLYPMAALAVALLGLTVGARVANQDLGAFAIVWGGSSSTAEPADLWVPPARSHHVEAVRHRVTATRTPKTARLAAQKIELRPARAPEFTDGFAFKAKNLSLWVKWMSRQARSVPPASLRWEGRQDWLMVPIVSDPMGAGFRVYRLSY